jgi:hypothetical protein
MGGSSAGSREPEGGMKQTIGDDWLIVDNFEEIEKHLRHMQGQLSKIEEQQRKTFEIVRLFQTVFFVVAFLWIFNLVWDKWIVP